MDQLRKKLKALQQRQRRLQHRAQLSKKERRVAVGLYVLDKYNTRAAEEYLAQRCRITGRSLVDSCHEVESWFLAAPEEGLETLSYPVTPSQKRCRNSIHKFLAEFRAVQFVRECNFQKGHAPAYAEVVEAYVQSLRDMGSSELAAALASSLDKKTRWARRWAQNWRQRWQLPLRTLKTHGVSYEDLTAKASLHLSFVLLSRLNDGQWQDYVLVLVLVGRIASCTSKDRQRVSTPLH